MYTTKTVLEEQTGESHFLFRSDLATTGSLHLSFQQIGNDLCRSVFSTGTVNRSEHGFFFVLVADSMQQLPTGQIQLEMLCIE
jgi:hypothetical protein